MRAEIKNGQTKLRAAQQYQKLTRKPSNDEINQRMEATYENTTAACKRRTHIIGYYQVSKDCKQHFIQSIFPRIPFFY